MREARLMGTARPLYKVDNAMSDAEKIVSLERRLVKERELRKAAEANALKFHALMLKARVDLITVRAALADKEGT
jgi:hypothetical protein